MSTDDKHLPLDEFGLPQPAPFELPEKLFTVLDYLSEEYAEASSLSEAIALRGHKAFLDKVTPEDFGKGLPEGITMLGFASLWSQSTWSDRYPEERNVELERMAYEISKGDVLVLGNVPNNFPVGSEQQNWLEIAENGFGFYHKGVLLPYTPYHDYDLDFFIEAIQKLNPHELIVCTVEEARCMGEDGVTPDPEFHWRVYSLDVVVYKMTQQ